MALTKDDLLVRARGKIEEVSIHAAKELLDAGAIVIDVREPNEFMADHLPGSVNVPRGVLEFKLDDVPALRDLDARIIIYCRSGGRGALATETLHDLGYTGVVNMAGGITAWREAELPIEKAPEVC